MRLIDADALGIGKCNPDVFENKAYADGWNAAVAIIENAPTVDAEPVRRHGKWIPEPDCGITRCSICGWSIEECINWDYCPNCGALMMEDDDGKK